MYVYWLLLVDLVLLLIWCTLTRKKILSVMGAGSSMNTGATIPHCTWNPNPEVAIYYTSSYWYMNYSTTLYNISFILVSPRRCATLTFQLAGLLSRNWSNSLKFGSCWCSYSTQKQQTDSIIFSVKQEQPSRGRWGMKPHTQQVSRQSDHWNFGLLRIWVICWWDDEMWPKSET